VAHARKAAPAARSRPQLPASAAVAGSVKENCRANESERHAPALHPCASLANRYEFGGCDSIRASQAIRHRVQHSLDVDVHAESIWSRRADGNRPGSRCPSARHRCLQRRTTVRHHSVGPKQSHHRPCARLVPDESDRYRPRRRLARFLLARKKPFSERQTARVFPELEAESTCSASPASPGP